MTASQYANVFDYADFRKFLEDYQEARYKEDKSWSKSGICKKLGLPNTRSFFNDVLKRRDISKAYIERFVEVLGLDDQESQFFRVLVQFNQSQLEKDRELLFDQLISLNRTPQKFVDPSAYAYYKKWYHSVIYAILDVEDYKGDAAALAKRVYPPVTPGQVRESITLLKKLKMITENEHGCLKPANASITVGSYVRDELIKQFQLQYLEMAKKVILARGDNRHNISTMTFSTNEIIFKKVEKKLQKFKSELRSMIHKDRNPTDRVYTLNLQLFPQTQQVAK